MIYQIDEAQLRLNGHVVKTPLLELPSVNDLLGFRLLLKAESLQDTGSFKIRGATNYLLQMSDDAKNKGVITFSSGNHGRGVARAAQRLGSSAIVIMPPGAPKRKIDQVQELGASVEIYDGYFHDRESYVQHLAEAGGRTFIPPYDHPHIIAGQATVAVEIADECASKGVNADYLFCPASGGGLLAGTVLAAKYRELRAELVAVEPHGFDDFSQSYANKSLSCASLQSETTIADALKIPLPGRLPFDIVLQNDVTFAQVDDREMIGAMRMLAARYNLLVEPSGATTLAAIMSRKEDLRNRTVVAIVSGGNVDLQHFSRYVNDN